MAGPPLAPRLRALLALLGLLCLGWLVAAPRASAFLYWTSNADGLTRANLDGTGLGFFVNPDKLRHLGPVGDFRRLRGEGR